MNIRRVSSAGVTYLIAFGVCMGAAAQKSNSKGAIAGTVVIEGGRVDYQSSRGLALGHEGHKYTPSVKLTAHKPRGDA